MIFGKCVNKFYKKYFFTILVGVMALIAVDFFQLEIPEVLGSIIDGLEYKTLTKTQLQNYMFELLIIALVMFTGRFLWRICIFGNGVKVETDLRNDMFIHSEKLSQEFYGENKTGALMALYTNDLQTIRMCFGSATVMLIDVLFLGALAFIKMWNMDWLLTLIASSPLLLLALCGGIVGKNLSKKSEANQKAFADLSDFAQESFSGITVIKAFVKELKEQLEFGKKNKKNMDTTMDMVKATTILQILVGALISLVNLIIIGYGGYLVYAYNSGITAHVFSIGDLTKFVSFFGTLTWPMMAIAQLINIRSRGQASVRRISDLLFHKVEINDNLVTDETRNIEIKGKITYNNLTFKYPETNTNVLENISLNINKGESVGILGKTGSGKTTMVDLLLRIYNLEENQLLIDDVDIMKIPLKTVRDAIAYVPQDNFLFSDYIKNNIAFSSNEVDIDKVIEAAKMSDVDDNIKEFSEKYETMLGERGVTVSGGQRQRISIARALIKDAPILILDDSVSAVDTKTEETILNNLKRTRVGKTTIIIAHRISTIQNLDKIVLIDQGKIIGVGNHEELLKTSTVYAKQVALQKLEEEVGGPINE